MDWMYEGTSGAIPREEYLLGKRIDKNFEAKNAVETPNKIDVLSAKESTSSSLPAVIDIETIRKEDPLVAIKVKEELARQEFLSNPIRMKQLQRLVLEAVEKKVKKSKKRKKARKSKREDSNSPSSSTASSDCSPKASEEHVSKRFQPRLSTDRRAMEKDGQRPTGKSSRRLEHADHYHRDEYQNSERSYKSTPHDNESSSERRNRYTEEDRYGQNVKHRSLSDTRDGREHRDYRSLPGSDRPYRKQRQVSTLEDGHRHRGRKERSPELDKYSRTKAKNYDSSRACDKSTSRHKPISSADSGGKLENSHKSGSTSSSSESAGSSPATTNAKGCSTGPLIKRENSDSDSDAEAKRRKYAGYGLVGVKRPPTSQEKPEAAASKAAPTLALPPPKAYRGSGKKSITAEERERLLAEMKDNAAWREQQRTKKIKRAAVEDQLEAKMAGSESAEFLRPVLANSCDKGSVEDRLKRKAFSLQRNKDSMNSNFVRR